MLRVLTYLGELAIVAVSVLIGRWVSEHYQIIPDWLFHFPDVWFDDVDFTIVLGFFVVVHAVIFALAAAVFGGGILQTAERAAKELYVLISAFAISAISLFLLTEIPFSPELLAASALTAFLIFVLVSIATLTTSSGVGPGSNFRRLLTAFFRQAIRPLGVVAILLALSPMVMAHLFVTDRDFANMITQVRLYFNAPDATGYGLVNAFGSQLFRQPMQVQFASDGTAYILERHGRLMRMPLDGGAPELLLDIVDRVGKVDVENGALGFDLHPEFGEAGSAGAGFVYVYYTAVSPDRQTNRLSRFDLSMPDPDARAADETILIAQDRHTSGFHNGGSVEFGPDGFLYLAIGEATAAKSHQRIDRSLFGGIMRIDVDQQGGEVSHPPVRQPDDAVTAGYYIPNDNPFVGQEGALEEFWALGLRNPFRVSFDGVSGEMWAGDVGSTRIEEVNIVRSGGNYEFPYKEGVDATGFDRPEAPLGLETGPVHLYAHTAYDRAVIGGVVYRQGRFADLEGKYIFADNYSGKILMIDASDAFQPEAVTIATAPQVAQQGVVSLSMDPDGDLLVTTLGRSQAETGQVLKLVLATEGADLDVAKQTPVPAMNSAEIREAYNSYCGRCHGEAGRGDGPDAAELTAELAAEMGRPMPDFSTYEFKSSRTDAELRDIILKGGEETGLSYLMPPWDGILSNQEVEALIHHIRGLHSH